jgi:hypothetical protein
LKMKPGFPKSETALVGLGASASLGVARAARQRATSSELSDRSTRDPVLQSPPGASETELVTRHGQLGGSHTALHTADTPAHRPSRAMCKSTSRSGPIAASGDPRYAKILTRAPRHPPRTRLVAQPDDTAKNEQVRHISEFSNISGFAGALGAPADRVRAPRLARRVQGARTR